MTDETPAGAGEDAPRQEITLDAPQIGYTAPAFLRFPFSHDGDLLVALDGIESVAPVKGQTFSKMRMRSGEDFLLREPTDTIIEKIRQACEL